MVFIEVLDARANIISQGSGIIVNSAGLIATNLLYSFYGYGRSDLQTWMRQLALVAQEIYWGSPVFIGLATVVIRF